MRVALFGPYMFELAVGLRENPANDVRLFLDQETLPRSLRSEAMLDDPDFVEIGPWVSGRSILRPSVSAIASRMADYDLALVTELGPVFARHSGIPYVFIPSGGDLTCGPFPLRSRSSRRRGIGDLSAMVVAVRMRAGIRAAAGLWGAPFAPFATAADRLGRPLTHNLPQPVDTDLFSPQRGPERLCDESEASERIVIFHPSRMMMSEDRFLVETGQCKRNQVLFEGMADAVAAGADVRLRLLRRASSPDEDEAVRRLEALGLTEHVEWLDAGRPEGFTWAELADLYRSADLVADEFGGWFGLVAIEGAACGRPVLNHVEPDTMKAMYPDGHPFLQASSAAEVAEAIRMIGDVDHRRRLVVASRQWVLRHHDRSVVARWAEVTLSEMGLVR